MLESNMRVVGRGLTLRLAVRTAQVDGTDTSPELLQKLCGRLRQRYGVAAVPDPRAPARLIVATKRPLEPLRLADDDWELEMTDAGTPEELLTPTDDLGRKVLPPLVERAFLATIARSSQLRMYGSPRLWYEPEPFCVDAGIAAYRRYEIGALLVDEVDIVIAVDIGTAFFTTNSLAYFYDPSQPVGERRAREQHLDELLGRQQGQKGTLQYDTGDTLSSCYFVQAPAGMTCGTTPKLRLNGTTYASLAAYYRAKHPEFGETDDLVAVQVSFPNLDRPQWVVAERLRARVMNEHLPRSLTQVDKLDPEERRTLITHFWDQLGPRPLGRIGQELAPGFWRPPATTITRHTPVALTYGQGARIPAATAPTWEAYRTHYRQRLDALARHGVYAMPAGADPLLYCAYPAQLNQEAIEMLVEDMTAQLTLWTNKQFTVEPIAYTSVTQAIEQLRQHPRGGVVFVLDDEPVAYHDVAFQLDGWRIKRITEETLCQKFRERTQGVWDNKLRRLSVEKGQRAWEQFVTMCTLDLVQQLDGVPYRIDQAGPYEAQLTIDVGHNRRFFALSLLVARGTSRTPSFCIATRVQAKLDHQHETINPVILQDELVKLVQETLGAQPDPLRSLLVLRDGRTLGQEYEAIIAASERLRSLDLLIAEAVVDIVDVHKESQTPLRLWELDATGRARNPLEGTVVQLNQRMVAITTTGQATLHQGTADPLLLMREKGDNCLQAAAEAVCAATHLNWDSPTMSQKLPLSLKRTDAELRAREAQEILRLR
jgi:hypothetical protein